MSVFVQRKNKRRISNFDNQIQQMLKKFFDFSKQKFLKNKKFLQTKRENSNVESKKRVKKQKTR